MLPTLWKGMAANMKLNGSDIKISHYTSEMVDEDTIIYNEDDKKIIILNHSAKFIWDEVRTSYLKNTDLNSSDILELLIKEYNISPSCTEKVKYDIGKAIDLLFETCLIRKNDGL